MIIYNRIKEGLWGTLLAFLLIEDRHRPSLGRMHVYFIQQHIFCHFTIDFSAIDDEVNFYARYACIFILLFKI